MSRMCRDDLDHHASTFDDFERIGRGSGPSHPNSRHDRAGSRSNL
jgi:hypothetical protein